MGHVTNCPNCGAPRRGAACEYCGTMFEPPEKVMSLALGKKVSMSFEHDGMLYEFDMVLEQANVNYDANPTNFYCCDKVVHTMLSPMCEATFSGRVVPSEKHGRECLVVARELFPKEIYC